MRRFSALLVLAALSGCTREPTPLALTGDQLMVHSMMLAGSDTVHVYVSRTLADPIRDPDLPGGFIFSRPVSGADVRLIQGEQTLTLSEAPQGFSACALALDAPAQEGPPRAGAGCYAAYVPGGIRPDRQYRLEVGLGAAGSVEGHAAVPHAPEFIGLTAPTRQPVIFTSGFWGGGPIAAIPVRYQLPPQVNGIRLAVRLGEVYRGDQRIADARCDAFAGDHFVRRSAQSDSTRVEFHALFCLRNVANRWEEFTPDSVLGHIMLTGFDSTYVRFAEAAQQRSAEGARLQAGVTGAFGVFAGAATASHPIVLVRSEPGPR